MQTLRHKTKDYPLYPYLEYQALIKQLSGTPQRQIDDFIQTYQDTPLSRQLHFRYLNHLAKTENWKDFLHYYIPSNSINLQCNRLQGLLAEGRAAEALSQVEPLWLSGHSQPDACDPVFDAWRNAGQLTTDLVWQRIALAMNASQYRLARYLRRFLPQEDQTWLTLWLKVNREPTRIEISSDFASRHPYREQILLHGLIRLASKDPLRARSTWDQVVHRFPFSAKQQQEAQRAIAQAMLRQGHPDALAYLSRMGRDSKDTTIRQLWIRAALLEQDWSEVLAGLATLSEQEAEHERSRYWQARALYALNEKKRADAIFRQLASNRSYYGFLAADQLGIDYDLQHEALEVKQSSLDVLARQPAIRRIKELLALDRHKQALTEWNFLVTDMDRDSLLTLAKLTQQWNWHGPVIFALARGKYWDDLEMRFPLEHRAQIEQQAKGQRLDSAWIFAVVRQESAFIADARSHAGARGLMQLMPGTARDLAKQLNKPVLSPAELVQPDTNIQFGTAYLKQVFQQLDHHPVLATAAYNAGPHRVRRWLPEETTPADIWIEQVPFQETRRYLQKVMMYTVIYEQRLDRIPSRLSQRMRPIKGRGKLVTQVRSKKDDSS